MKTAKKLAAAGGKPTQKRRASRTWYPTGVALERSTKKYPSTLPEQIKRQITTQLRSEGLSGNPSFFEALEKRALFAYRRQQEVSEANSPGKVRGDLKKACDAAAELTKSLERLADTAKFLTASYSELLSQASDIEKRLHDALEKTDDYPKSGALPDDARLLLAVEVAHAMHEHLQLQPTSTKAGLYEEILTIVLGVATGGAPRQVNALARRALRAERMRVEQEDGVIMWDTRVSN